MDIWTHKTFWRMTAVDKRIWKFLPSFCPVFSLCHLWPCPEDYSINSLEYLPMHLLEMEPLLCPAGRYFLFSQSFSSAAALLSSRYVNGFLIDYPVCVLDLQFNKFFFPLLASAKGKTFQGPWCHTLKVAFLCWDRPSLRCRFLWSSGVSFWRFWCPTIASYMRERMDLMCFIPPPGSFWTLGQLCL